MNYYHCKIFFAINLDKKLLNAVGAFDNETVAAIKNYSGSVPPGAEVGMREIIGPSP